MKQHLKAILPRSWWEKGRALARRSLLGGILFNLSLRRYRTDGCVFSIPNVFSLADRSQFLFDLYEAPERELVKRLIQDTDTVLELGGCMGVVSCVTNKHLKERSSHLVVEANPFVLNSLWTNRANNACEFSILNAAVGPDVFTNFSLTDNPLASNSYSSEMNKIPVPSFPLEWIINRFGPFSVLLSDIEGAEMDYFSRSQEALSSFRLIILEMHPEAYGQQGVAIIRNKLRNLGFTRDGEESLVESWVKKP